MKRLLAVLLVSALLLTGCGRQREIADPFLKLTVTVGFSTGQFTITNVATEPITLIYCGSYIRVTGGIEEVLYGPCKREEKVLQPGESQRVPLSPKWIRGQPTTAVVEYRVQGGTHTLRLGVPHPLFR